MVTNMDTVGTFEMAKTLANHGCFTCMHKFHSADHWAQFAKKLPEAVKYLAANSCTGAGDWERLHHQEEDWCGLSAVLQCADGAHGLGGHIIIDGGCTCPGYVAKAFGAGADFVMMGCILAGHDQSGGGKVKVEKHSGGFAEYSASEGKTVEVPYRGDVNITMLDVLGGIRSVCTYTGFGKLKEMPKRTTFIRVSQQLNEVFIGGQPNNPTK